MTTLRQSYSAILYLISVACQHFCKFKEAGSNFRNTHVHYLHPPQPDSGDVENDSLLDKLEWGAPTNPNGYTGLGHDDGTPGLKPGSGKHNTVSKGDTCEFRPSPSDVKGLQPTDIGATYFLTAWFHECTEREECPEGFLKVKCSCGWMCVTWDMKVYDRWHDALPPEDGEGNK